MLTRIRILIVVLMHVICGDPCILSRFLCEADNYGGDRLQAFLSSTWRARTDANFDCQGDQPITDAHAVTSSFIRLAELRGAVRVAAGCACVRAATFSVGLYTTVTIAVPA